MVTAPKVYGSYQLTSQCSAMEPPAVMKVRSEFDNVVNNVLREFINESAHATALGIKALDAGDFITLDKLEELIIKG